MARVRLAEGSGQITINGRGLDDYFTEDKDRAAVIGPLQLAEMSNKLDLFVNVKGGGFTGQAGAICQGIARALKTMFGLDTAGAATPSEDGGEPPAGGFAKTPPRFRLPDPRRPDEGTQEVRPQGRPQVVPVLEAIKSECLSGAQAPVKILRWRSGSARFYFHASARRTNSAILAVAADRSKSSRS